MSLKWYLTIMIAGTLMSLLAFVLIIVLMSPQEAGSLGFFLFYMSLFLSILGMGALIGLWIRHVRAKKKYIVEKVIISFRQAFWFAVVAVGGLLLQGHDQLSWLNALLLVLIVTVLEFFFASAKVSREHRKYQQ